MKTTIELAREAGFEAMRPRGLLPHVPEAILIANVCVTENKVGLLGVSMKGNRFRAQITINQKKKMLGTFATATEAHEAYVKAKREIHIGGTL
jgi:hypothetical protein